MSSSLSINQVIESARQLVQSLKQDDATVNKVHTDAMSILRKLEAMKEYSDEIGLMETTAKPQNSRSALVSAIQKENRQLNELKRENIELTSALEDHQSTLQMVMTKYRQQVMAFTKHKEVELACATQLNSTQESHRLADKINEMAGVMRLAADIDENNSISMDEQLAHLKKENQVLRELLEISGKSGSLKGVSPNGPGANGANGMENGSSDYSTIRHVKETKGIEK